MTEKRLALIIATEHYEDKDLCQLISPAHDAEALGQVLKDPAIGSFDVRTLLNKPSYEVEKEIEEFFTERKRDDILLLYFSGHGIKDEDGLLYFCTTNTKRKLLRSTAVESNFVNNVMHRSRSQMQVLLLDCCYSGAFARGASPKADKAINTKERFTGKGLVVLTASDAMQYSFEGGIAEPSVFTSSLVQGLKTGAADSDGDGDITPHELYDYVYTTVIDKKPEQRPHMWNYGVEGKIVIAHNPNPVVKPVELSKELLEVMNNPSPVARVGAVHALRDLLYGENKGLSLSALNSLKIMQNDDSRRVSVAATKILDAYENVQQVKESAPEAKQSDVEKEEMMSIDIKEKITIQQEQDKEDAITKTKFRAIPVENLSKEAVVETETPQPEEKDEKENIVQQPTIISERSSTAISTRKPLLLWLLPVILVPVISGIVVSIIFFSNRQPIVPPPIVETPKKIEEISKPLEKVEKVPATEIKEIKFRSEPIKGFSKESVKSMLRRYNFYCKEYDWNKVFSNPQGSGFQNDFEPQVKGGDRVILDHASGLMWQQSGSREYMAHDEAKDYIRQLNEGAGFAGYRDWRLPTLEEAMSLMEPTQMNGDLYIDPKFDKQQWGIWTSDTYSASSAWVVSFHGGCYGNDFNNLLYVRAVR